MRQALFAVIALAAAGCLGGGTLAPSRSNNDVALYGPVPIIRPGMDLSEVGRVSDYSPDVIVMGSFSYCQYVYPGGPIITTGSGKVGRCYGFRATNEGPNPHSPLEDVYLELKLRTGMSSRQVEAILGSPKYGAETAAGSVELVYPEREVAVEYQDGLLVCWRKTVVYKH